MKKKKIMEAASFPMGCMEIAGNALMLGSKAAQSLIDSLSEFIG